jgi:two-component system response regulator HydG
MKRINTDMFSLEDFTIIFIDIKMSLMDGVETYRRIKEIRPETMAVMMTGYAVEDLVEQALQEGVYGVIYKPLDMEEAVALEAHRH